MAHIFAALFESFLYFFLISFTFLHSNEQRKYVLLHLSELMTAYGYSLDVPMDSTAEYVVPELSANGIRQSCSNSTPMAISLRALAKANTEKSVQNNKKELEPLSRPLVVLWNFSWPSAQQLELAAPSIDPATHLCRWSSKPALAEEADLVLFSGTNLEKDYCKHSLVLPSVKVCACA